MYYFAYGSNMDEQRMKAERKIPFSTRCAAHLYYYHLKFNKVAQKNPQEGKANIVPDVSGLVEGALYDIDATSLPKLDKCEGYPDEYLKISIKVILPSDGQDVCAITYIANPNKIGDELKPSKKYMSYLLAGEDVLSQGYFNWLQKTETLD